MLKSGSEVFNRVGRLVARGQPNKSQRHRVWMLRNRSNFKASWGFVPFLFGTSPSCQVFWVIGWGVWQSYVIWPTFMLSCIWKSRHYAFSICSLLSNLIDRRCYTVWIKKFPCGFLTFFPKRLGIFKQSLTHLLHVPIYARLQIFIQLFPTLTKLCHTKRDHPPNFFTFH